MVAVVAHDDELELNEEDDNDDDLLLDEKFMFEQVAMQREELNDETDENDGITWARDEGWSTRRQDYSGNNEFCVEEGSVKLHLEAEIKAEPTNLKRVTFDQLNAKQRVAFKMARRARSPDATPEQKRMLLLGKGGTGKSHTVTLFILF